MTISDVDKVANVLLYEGYLLYPFRPSTLEHRQPFTFGVIAPGEEMQTECIVEGDASTIYEVRVRFLQRMDDRQVVEREIIGATTFSWPPLSGEVGISTVRYADGMIRLRVRIVNTSNDPTRDMLATHTILRVSGGTFLSMIDPPAIYQKLTESCKNIRTWPVLAGERGQHQIMLSSSFIVYDYPEVADERT
ncbi:MAG TPA: hypothetical protein VFA43_15520 [Gemmatimonadaceae bacterium]|nr:hypothetical protein [Gemmatimonadaceae bacterium]